MDHNGNRLVDTDNNWHTLPLSEWDEQTLLAGTASHLVFQHFAFYWAQLSAITLNSHLECCQPVGDMSVCGIMWWRHRHRTQLTTLTKVIMIFPTNDAEYSGFAGSRRWSTTWTTYCRPSRPEPSLLMIALPHSYRSHDHHMIYKPCCKFLHCCWYERSDALSSILEILPHKLVTFSLLYTHCMTQPQTQVMYLQNCWVLRTEDTLDNSREYLCDNGCSDVLMTLTSTTPNNVHQHVQHALQ